MKLAASIVFCALCGLAAGGDSSPAKIDGDTLVWWSRDYKGVAVVTPNVRHIGNGAFSGCKSLTGVVLPQSVETIGQVAFLLCESLRDVQIPSSVTNIGSSAFQACHSMTSLVVRAKIEKIPASMCSGCYGLRHVELPNGVTEIGNAAFCACRSIRGLPLPESVSRIGPYAFTGCRRLRCVELPRDLRQLGNSAFEDCSDMKYVVVHPGLKVVKPYAFRGCLHLRGFIAKGEPPDLEDGIFFGPDGQCSVFAVRDSPAGNAGEECLGSLPVKFCKSIEEAIAACESSEEKEPDNEMFKGIERALRFAADGVVAEMTEHSGTSIKIDRLAADVHELAQMDKVADIKRFLRYHSEFSGDDGEWMTAHIDFVNGFAIMARFKKGTLVKLELSEWLQKAIRDGLKAEAVEPDESVMRWLE